MDANGLLSTLRLDGPASPVKRLAELSVDALLDTPWSAWLKPAEVGEWARRLLSAFFAAPSGQAAVARVVEALVAELQRERRSVDALLPRAVRTALREVIRRPFSPDRRAVLMVLDREPFRQLVRQILLDAVLEFGRRASAPVAGVAKGLGTLARMAQETVRSRSGSGGLSGLVGAVGSEVERQLEKRAAEFVDTALSGVLGQLADAVADPRRADEAADLRLSLFDGAMGLTGPQLARELVNADVPGAVELLRNSLHGWLGTAEATAALEGVGAFIVSLGGTRTARQELEALGLFDPVRALAVEQTQARIAQVVATPAFAAWLTSLFEPPSIG